MSQAGIINVINTNPSIPITFVGNTGPGATAALNILNVVGSGSISVAASGNTLTITDSGGGIVWSDKALSFAASSNNGYFVSATATGTLPSTPAQGDQVEFAITNSGVTLTIQASPGQRICVGTDLSLVVGTTVSTQLGSSISLTYQASSSTWFSVTSPQGTWTTT